jgi:hypothetical protein
MMMEPTESSETSAINITWTPGTYPKDNKLQLEHGESLKSRTDDPISSPKPTTMTEVNDDVDEDFTEILDRDVSLSEASRQSITGEFCLLMEKAYHSCN